MVATMSATRDRSSSSYAVTGVQGACMTGVPQLVIGRAVPPGRFAPDDWVSVTGRIYPLGNEILVDASAVQAIPQPERPYLTP